jgi:6-phosphogluconate dehydrogenase
MNFGIVGLGRMGYAIAKRVIDAGHVVFGFDINKQAQRDAHDIGVHVVDRVEQLLEHTDIIWLMLPAGDLIDEAIKTLKPKLKKGAIIIDGGNSNFKDSIRREKQLKDEHIFYLDCGTSGGLRGEEIGFSLMVGGDETAYTKMVPLFQAIAAKNGFGLVGPSGAGHYVKMVHNGIEYALLQAYAEGFHLIKHGYFKNEDLDLAQISDIWMHGSIIRSYILELAHDVFKVDQKLESISGEIAESGTGKWTVQEAHEQRISVPVIEDALHVRKVSREQGGNFATKIVAMLRNKFGGHAVKKIEKI